MIRTLLLALTLATSTAAADLPPPLTDAEFEAFPDAEVRLGQLLFYDPILSGNRNISCATCHHPRFATGDGLSLGLGEGGTGLGPDRRPDPANPPEQLIPRNAPPLFNLGHRDLTVLFADGRIEVDATRPSGLRTPLEDEMVAGFASLLSAQTMFPVLSPDEMAGHYQENDIAKAVRQGRLTGQGGAWDLIAQRIAAIPAYQAMFDTAYADIADGSPIAFTDISNAIAAFMAIEWRADETHFDQYLRGEAELSETETAGLTLFFGEAGCAECHSGPLLSDQRFHAMGTPQLGPGKAERFESHQNDIGRMRVTGRAEDAYAFRTPMLRNVTRTGPWGHAGGHTDLAAFLSFHADPKAGLETHTRTATLPPLSEGAGKPVWQIMEDAAAVADLGAAVTVPPRPLTDDQIADLLAFLTSLEDPPSLTGRLGIPQQVPSGLPIDR